MICDAYGGEVLRDAPRVKLAAARRKSVTLAFALAAARRLQSTLEEPSALSDRR